MDYASIIKEIGRGVKGAKAMDQSVAEAVFGALLDGEIPDMEVGAILLSLRIKGEDVAELVGFKAALDRRTRFLSVPDGHRCVILPTYNGARKQPNLMPLVALLLSRENIPVLIQGRHDFESRSSPFELLQALGIVVTTDLDAASSLLQEGGVAGLPLESLAPGLNKLLDLRRRLGVRNSGHTLAKLLDPCPGSSVRVVAVTHPPYLDILAKFLSIDRGTALLMRGTEGEAYANPRRRPRMLGFQQSKSRELCEAAEFDDVDWTGGSCSTAANAELIERFLAGDIAIPRSIIDQVQALKALAQAL